MVVKITSVLIEIGRPVRAAIFSCVRRHGKRRKMPSLSFPSSETCTMPGSSGRLLKNLEKGSYYPEAVYRPDGMRPYLCIEENSGRYCVIAA